MREEGVALYLMKPNVTFAEMLKGKWVCQAFRDSEQCVVFSDVLLFVVTMLLAGSV